ncbi:HpcH/HpaI aldolase family protein [Geomonas oryzae]|uniref:HpcH/HpaI aldolase family protein n=1 Tax=Geomonas oryzae TaxID=2364273 RepID=UPI00100B7AE6|nr:aldolase/citrate lyase family protein [Geomonas oryzae]
MHQNPLKKKLAEGKPVLGMWSILPSQTLSEIFGRAGLDFLILDMEHGPFGLKELDACVRACEGAGCSPLVRVPGPSQFTIQSVMDLGIHGLIVPQVQDAASVREALRCMKYAPEGIRGYNPFTRAAGYAGAATNQAGKLNNGFSFKSIIVENQSACDSIDAILEIEDLDMVYIGVYDLSVAMGCQGDTQHPRVTSFLETAVKKCRAAGKAAGMMVRSEAEIGAALSLGANFLVYSVDSYFIHRAASDVVESLARITGQN